MKLTLKQKQLVREYAKNLQSKKSLKEAPNKHVFGDKEAIKGNMVEAYNYLMDAQDYLRNTIKLLKSELSKMEQGDADLTKDIKKLQTFVDSMEQLNFVNLYI